MHSFIFQRARQIMGLCFQRGDGARQAQPKAAKAEGLDPRAAWEAYFDPFCQAATASGARWACYGDGSWELLEAHGLPLELAVDELLEHFGMPGRLALGELEQEPVATVQARRLAVLYRLGLRLPMEYLQRARDTEGGHGHEEGALCPQRQRREAEYPYCDKRSQRAGRFRCALKRALDRRADAYIHGNASSAVVGSQPHSSRGGDSRQSQVPEGWAVESIRRLLSQASDGFMEKVSIEITCRGGKAVLLQWLEEHPLEDAGYLALIWLADDLAASPVGWADEGSPTKPLAPGAGLRASAQPTA